MKNLLVLLFIFVSSTSAFCQTTGMNYWLPRITENQDTSEYFSSIREDALRLGKEDTLVYFSFGGNGYHGLGGGHYDFITKPYTFIYSDAFMGCMAPKHLHRAADIHNEIISLELAKRHGEGWKREVDKEIDSYRKQKKIKAGRMADVFFEIGNKQILSGDTINVENIERLNLEILNLDKIYSHDIKIEMTLAKNRKGILSSEKILVVSDFENPIISFIKENILLDYNKVFMVFYAGLNDKVDGSPYYFCGDNFFHFYIKR